LASYNSGVTVAIISISNHASKLRKMFAIAADGTIVVKEVENINAYLVPAKNIFVERALSPIGEKAEMPRGNMPYDGGHLLLSAKEVDDLTLTLQQRRRFIRRIYGSAEFIKGLERFCLWIEDQHLEEANRIESIRKRIEGVRRMREASRDRSANEMAAWPHRFREMNIASSHTFAMPRVSSENREFLPVGLLRKGAVVTDLAFAIYDAPLWNISLIASRLHLVWIATVCGQLETRYRYSNTLGWNTFPVPTLTDQNKMDLTRCAEDILLAREAHFPATIAELYDPETMPADLREAHERNDETLERIYIGRRFKNDTERLEKLFELYTQMIARQAPVKGAAKGSKKQAGRKN
jgi:hypothetical protein